MEVTVLEVTNPPSKPVLAIHAGSVRRQAKLEVNQPFVIPHPGSQTGPVEVSLFQQLASQVLPHDSAPEVFCNIPVKKLDGTSSQVQLRVRRGDAANANKPLTKGDDSMGLTRDYLDQHQLQQRIQSLIQDVLREQPDNPYKYMLGQLKKAKDKNGKTIAIPPAKPSAPKEPLVPRAPESKKPDRPDRPGTIKPAAPEVDAGGNEQRVQSKGSKEQARCSAARFSVANLLRMPLCQQAAEQSLRHAVRQSSAKSMCSSIINSVKEKITDSVRQGLDVDKFAQTALDAEVLLPPEYNRAIACWARHIAYRGAGHILGVSRRKSQSEDEGGRRSSLPTPMVFLPTEGFSWGSPSTSPVKVGGSSMSSMKSPTKS